MGSVRSRFFIFLLKHRHWFRLKLRRETIDWNTSIPKLRQRVENSAGRLGKVLSEIEVSPLETNEFSAEWIRTERETAAGSGGTIYHAITGHNRALSHRTTLSDICPGSHSPI